MSIASTYSTDLGVRLVENPILMAHDVPASQPDLEVVSVFNAACTRMGDEYILLLRVAERPRSDQKLQGDEYTLDFSGTYPVMVPMLARYRKEEVIGMSFLDTSTTPPRIKVVYLPRDLPGLDLSDPRAIRYHNSAKSNPTVSSGHQDYLAQISHLRIARSQDGVHFTVEPGIAIAPEGEMEEYGVEDARITFIDDEYHITYVSVSRWGITTSLATTRDFITFERKGIIFLPDHKDVVIFPEQIENSYFALTRPMPQSFAHILGIWIAKSQDKLGWREHATLALPRAGMWDSVRTGASAVPFKTTSGWLELYHGVSATGTYAMGALLLDGTDPTRILARSSTPILSPRESYERTGLFNDTIFSCGVVPLDEVGERIRMYYGAADSVMAAADFKVQDILDSLSGC